MHWECLVSSRHDPSSFLWAGIQLIVDANLELHEVNGGRTSKQRGCMHLVRKKTTAYVDEYVFPARL